MYKIENYYLSKGNLFDLYNLLKDVTNILEKNKIKYWADGGTLLGICRNGGQIIYDDDVDIGIDTNDKYKLFKITDEFTKIGYHISDYGSMVKIFIKDKWLKNDYRIFGTPTLDIFFYKKKKDKYILDSLYYRQKYKESYYLKKNIVNLKKMKYFDLDINVCDNPYEILDRQYKDWQNKLVVEVRDENNTKDKKLLFDRLTEEFIGEL